MTLSDPLREYVVAFAVHVYRFLKIYPHLQCAIIPSFDPFEPR